MISAPCVATVQYTIQPTDAELNGADYVCGHNIIHHDAKYLSDDTVC